MANINHIEGIGDFYADKLHQAGIRTIKDLLDNGATKKGRKILAEATGVNEKKILEWVNMADLFRIKGVAGQYAELLKASGVDTVKELRNRKAENLYSKLREVNQEKKLARAIPAQTQIEGFIQQAKNLPPIITH